MVLDPHTRIQLADIRAQELQRAAARARGSRLPYGTAGSAAELPFVIRAEQPDDQRALTRLAALDSASVPASPLLVAEVGGELWAALSLSDGAAIADPFHRTASLVDLLAMRAAQLRGEPVRRGRLLGRWRRAVGRRPAAALPRP